MQSKSIRHFPLLILLFLRMAIPVCAQHYTERPEFIRANSNWIFGSWWGVNHPNNGTGINFNANPPLILQGTGLTSAEAAAAISDTATGALLFYSNGESCWNRNYDIMPNGDNLSGDRSTNQGAGIVPVIDTPGKYYLFTSMAYNFGSVAPGLYYSKVDMSLDGGLGDIVPGEKNILLDSGPLQESMLVVPGDNCDLWLIVHPYYTPEFRAYHITAAGIDPNPVISNTGPALSGTIAAYELGGMAVSPDRSLLAITSYSPSCLATGLVSGLGGILLAQFDPATGQLNNPLYIDDSTAGYSVCFSPDNTKLYAQGIKSDPSGSAPGSVDVVQYDVSTYTQASISSSRTVLFTAPFGTYQQLFNLRRRGDTIILADMHYISAPNQAGLACGFHATPLFQIDSIESNLGIGSDAVYPLPPDTVFARMLDTQVCRGQGFTLTAPAAFAAYRWNDGSTGNTLDIADTGVYWVFSIDKCHSRVDTFVVRLKADVAVSLGPDTIVCGPPPLLLMPEQVSPGTTLTWPDGSQGPGYEALQSGTYWVTASKGGCLGADSIEVAFRELQQDLGPDIFVCKGEPVQLRLEAAVSPGASVRWSDGSTEPSILLTDTGRYWVSVQDPPCAGSDTILVSTQVCHCALNVPSAFSPNGDGLNDIFYPVIENGCPVKQYSLSIYNRFGQRIFFSADQARGWNGTHQGVPVDAGTYFYQLRFKGGVYEKEYSRKGDLAVIR